MSSSSCLRSLPRLLLPYIFTSVTYFRRQCLPIRLAFLLFTVCMIFLSMQHFLISHTIFQSDLLHPSPAPHFKTLQVFLTFFPKCPKFQHYTKNKEIKWYKTNLNLTLLKQNLFKLAYKNLFSTSQRKKPHPQYKYLTPLRKIIDVNS